MADETKPDPGFTTVTARLLRQEAIRRAAEERNTTSPAGLEDVLGRISAEVTAEAAAKRPSSQAAPHKAV